MKEQTRRVKWCCAESRAGFTLVEVLLAISIVGIMVTLVYESFQRTLNTREFIEDVEARYHNVRLAMNRMAREISMAYLSDIPNRSPDEKTKTLFIGKKEAPFDRLTFTSFGHLRLMRDVKEGDQNVVCYYAEPDSRDHRVTNLIRREKPLIADEDTNLDDNKGTALALAEDIEELRFEYYDEPEKDWTDEWDTTQIEEAGKLPQRVRIFLKIKDEAGKDITFVTQSKIFMRKPLNL